MTPNVIRVVKNERKKNELKVTLKLIVLKANSISSNILNRARLIKGTDNNMGRRNPR